MPQHTSDSDARLSSCERKMCRSRERNGSAQLERDMWVAMSEKRTMPYVVTFHRALQEAVETEPGKGRDRAMEGLLKRADARGAHPTFEHMLPIHVGVGAAGEDKGR